MKTRINIWILIGIFGLILIGLLLRNWKILAMSIPMITFLTLTNLLLPSGHRIRIERSLGSELVYEGKELTVCLLLVNQGPKVSTLEVHDVIPTGAEVKRGSNHFLTKLEPGETKEIEYSLEIKIIGNYKIGPVLLKNMNFIGSYVEHSYKSKYSSFSVIPYLEEIKKIKIAPKRTRLWLGNILSRKIGLGSEFFTLAEYHIGDELRKINWKASSRHDRLYVNDYEAEKSGDVTIIIDARRSAVGSSSYARNTLYYEIKAALSIATRILHDRNRVGLIVQKDVMTWISLGYGRTQFYKLLYDLLKTRSSGTLPFEYTAWIVKNYFPTQTQIVIISPLTDKRIIDYVIQLRAFKYDILIISPCPFETEKMSLPKDEFTETASKMLKIERDNYISELRRFANVVDWNVNESIVEALRSVRISKPIRG